MLPLLLVDFRDALVELGLRVRLQHRVWLWLYPLFLETHSNSFVVLGQLVYFCLQLGFFQQEIFDFLVVLGSASQDT